MPKSRHNRHSKKIIKGGFWPFSNDSTTQPTSTQEGSNWFSNLFGTKKSTTPSYVPSNSTSYGESNYGTSNTNMSPPNQVYGGKMKRRSMKGGFTGYTPKMGLAANSASFSGPTAQPQVWLGGKRTRKHRHGGRKHRHSKSCKHHNH